MSYTWAEELETIRLVEESDLPVKKTLEQLQVGRSTFYRWYRTYVDQGAEGLKSWSSCRRQFWKYDEDKADQPLEIICLQIVSDQIGPLCGW